MSGKRFEILSNNEIYHVFNRSVANEQIFIKSKLLNRALSLIEYYRYPQKLRYSFYKRLPKEPKEEYFNQYKQQEKLVEIYAFCLMPNHFHLLIKQLTDEGIKTFISNFENSFSKYFNLINNRAGSVFQKPFKAKRIESDEILLHVERYIHINPVTSFLIEFKDLEKYPWTSYPIFLKKVKSDLVDTESSLKIVGSTHNYKKFLENQIDYQRKLYLIKHLIFE